MPDTVSGQPPRLGRHALGAIAAIVLILIHAPQGLITTVGTLALVATVLAVTIMVRRRESEPGERS